jgi:hypothetical protein
MQETEASYSFDGVYVYIFYFLDLFFNYYPFSVCTVYSNGLYPSISTSMCNVGVEGVRVC